MPKQEIDYESLIAQVPRVFSPSAPINDRDLFSGRANQIRAIVDAFDRRGQHVVIYGERGVGKTSLASVIKFFFEGMISERIFFVSCNENDDYTSVWRKVFNEMRLERERFRLGFNTPTIKESISVGEILPENIDPDTVRQILARFAGSDNLVLIIDEFDRIPKRKTGLFADTIKSLSDRSIKATIILVGVADSVDQLVSRHKSVERALAQIQMPRMSLDELNEIITKGLGKLSMDIDGDSLRRIAHLSRGLPHYTHLVGLHAARTALQRSSLHISGNDVDTAIRESLREAQQSIQTVYNMATTSPRKDSLFEQVMLASAFARTDSLGFFSAADVRAPMSKIMGKPYDIPSYARHLNAFTDKDRGPVLQRMGEKRRYRYRFINPLLQPYVTMQGFAKKLISKEIISGLEYPDGDR